MLKIEFSQTDYKQLLQHFATQLNSKFENNMLTLSLEAGSGFLKLIVLPNGLQCIVSDYTVAQDVLFNRTPVNEDLYMLRFDEVMNAGGSETSAKMEPVRSAVFLGSAKFKWLFIADKGTRVKGIDIVITKEWLQQFIGVESVGDIIKKYFSLKMSALNHEAMDTEYKRIFSEIIQPDVAPMFESAVVQNRLMLLLERFFTRTYQKMSDTHFHTKISNDDIERMKLIEKEIMRDLSKEPKNMEELAKLVSMSSSKLKKCFKEAFGLPLYQYYQKKRMNKAKAMLVSRNYNVREVGTLVGYNNISNFSKAFKQAFDQLPSDLLE